MDFLLAPDIRHHFVVVLGVLGIAVLVVLGWGVGHLLTWTGGLSSWDHSRFNILVGLLGGHRGLAVSVVVFLVVVIVKIIAITAPVF